MTDIEMLVLAAKAVSLKHVDYSGSGYSGSLGLQLIDNVGRHTVSWNPVKDDGDAFRLMTRLKFSIDRWNLYVNISIGGDFIYRMMFDGTLEEDEFIRLAIVMAAAEIGKGM